MSVKNTIVVFCPNYNKLPNLAYCKGKQELSNAEQLVEVYYSKCCQPVKLCNNYLRENNIYYIAMDIGT